MTESEVELLRLHEVAKETLSDETFQKQMESKLNVFRDMGNKVFDVGHFLPNFFRMSVH